MAPTPSAGGATRLPSGAHTFALARLASVALVAITALGLVLRIWEIGKKGIWLDEAFSVWLGWQPLGDLLGWLLKVDQHPPLYYSLLHFWIKLAGDDPTDVRLLSALLGTLTIPVIFFLGRRLMGPAVGLIAALILALSPFHVRFAQETRMYTALALNASLALLALSHILTDPRSTSVPMGRQFRDFYRTRRPFLPIRAITTDLVWVGYMIFTAATMLSHNTAVLFPVATNLFVLSLILWRRGAGDGSQDGHRSGVGGQGAGERHYAPRTTEHRFAGPSTANWLLAQLGVFLLWSPWLVAFVLQAAGVYQEFWISRPTWGAVLDMLKTFLSAMLPGQDGWGGIIWAAYGLLALLGIVHLRKRPVLLAFLAVLFLTPIAGELLVSLRRPIFYDRTLIWITIPLYLLLAAGIAQLRYRPYVLGALAAVAMVNALSLQQYYTLFGKEEWDKAAAYVAERVETEDLLLFNATWVQIPFDYYYRQYDHPVAKHGVPVDLFDRGVLEPKMAASDLPRLHDLISGRKRVWLIYSHNWYTDPTGLIATVLSQDLKQLDQRQFDGLEVRLYGVP